MDQLKVAIVQNISINDHRMVHTDGIARELVKRGHDVEVIIQESRESPQFKYPPYNVTSIPGATYSIKGQLKFIWNLYNTLKNRELDIIHAKNPLSSIIPSLLVKRLDHSAQVIYDIRGLWVDFGMHSNQIGLVMGAFLKGLDNVCMNHSDAVIAISDELKIELEKRGVRREKITVIVGDGVRIGETQAGDIENILKDLEGKVIGYVGGIGRSRSSESIVEAFDILISGTKEKVNLVMVGPFVKGEREYFQNMVNEKGLSNRVHFTGFLPHDQALDVMKRFDIAVSYHQGDKPIFNVAVPTKVLEYLAAGLCIVATDQTMYKNILTHNVDAYLTKQNPESFAKGLQTILDNHELARRLRDNARNTAQKYTFQKVTDQLETLYNKIIDNST